MGNQVVMTKREWVGEVKKHTNIRHSKVGLLKCLNCVCACVCVCVCVCVCIVLVFVVVVIIITQ